MSLMKIGGFEDKGHPINIEAWSKAKYLVCVEFTFKLVGLNLSAFLSTSFERVFTF